MKAVARRVYGWPLLLLVLAVLLGAVHQMLFFEHEPGVSFPLFVLLFYVFMYLGTEDQLRPADGFSRFLAAAVALLSLTFILFDSAFFRGMNILAVPALVLLHMAYRLDWRRPEWDKLRLPVYAVDHLLPQNLRHWITALELVLKSVTGRLEEKRREALKGVVLGLVIACPLLVVIISLLASADGMFQNMLSGIPDWFAGLSLAEGMVRFLWTLIMGLCFFGYVFGFRHPMKGEKESAIETAVWGAEESRDLPKMKKGLNPVTAATVLGLVNVVYVLFVAVQFSYLFGAWEGSLPEGSTYAEYARRGFGELVMATSLNYLILLASLPSAGRQAGGTGRFNRIMLYLLVGCSCVMLYSAYIRLGLYEEAYGYTVIRFLVHAFMIFLSLLLVLAAVRVGVPRFPLVRCYIVLGLSAYVLMNFIGMESTITRLNLERYQESGKLDGDYLLSLSSDAVVRLARFDGVEYPDMEGRLRIKLELLQENRGGWQEFNISDYRARKALEKRFGE